MTIKQNHYRHPFAGYTIGILAPNLDYEKTLGNVANAETFPFFMRLSTLTWSYFFRVTNH
ncbi:hypothetical protein [Fructobacillus fructosus]|uniref:hypothetical protein n=1 Tax=Fructobacillus fructosus TaxID=1631 RepID=UPI00200ACA18|nr:hypothetical protein [Fructobacillus fructosus]MCK8638924.1 hypothetical protein [Fructobacillus fructosus]